MIAVSFANVSRHFGNVRAVDNVNLNIKEGEFYAMLGPSGSGKSTCLRLIAGFEQPSAGHIELFGERADEVPPYRRNVNTVFQDYALFPHLNVVDNVAYGLMISGVGKSSRRDRANEVLELVQLPGYGLRKTSELSGGQRQRVALARALINKPRVLLLDEPLGALDLQLREQMQLELRHLQQALGITFVFVTHDQGEAFSMADRIAIFNEGRIVQAGSPQQIYRKPENRFVANFVGSSNIVSAEFAGMPTAGRRWASLRPESVHIVQQGGREATVLSCSFLGGSTKLQLDVNGTRLSSLLVSNASVPDPGATVRVNWLESDVHLMDEEA